MSTSFSKLAYQNRHQHITPPVYHSRMQHTYRTRSQAKAEPEQPAPEPPATTDPNPLATTNLTHVTTTNPTPTPAPATHTTGSPTTYADEGTAKGPTSPLDERFATKRLALNADGNLDSRIPASIKECITCTTNKVLPPMLNSDIAASTKDLTKTEEMFPYKKQLRWIALFPDLIQKAQEKFIALKHLDPKSDIDLHTLVSQKMCMDVAKDIQMLCSLHPSYTGCGLPPKLRSEVDTTSYINAKWVWPAVQLIRYVQKEMLKNNQSAYVSSSGGKKKKAIPDGLIVQDTDASWSHGVLEWKTHNALEGKHLNAVVALMERLQPYHVPLRVWWGVSEGPGKSDVAEKRRKLISQVCLSCSDFLVTPVVISSWQVWSQMTIQDDSRKAPDIHVAGLSSFEWTYFFFRRTDLKKYRNVMFMSPPLEYRSVTVLKYASMLALALGITKLDASDIPTFDEEAWEVVDKAYGTVSPPIKGVDMKYVPA